MARPPCDAGDFLLTHRAESVLLFPEMDEPAFSLQGICNVSVQALFIVGFPFWIVGVSLAFDLCMPFDRHTGRICEVVFLPILLSVEDPVLLFVVLEVLLRDPFIGFVCVSSFRPPPDPSVARF